MLYGFYIALCPSGGSQGGREKRGDGVAKDLDPQSARSVTYLGLEKARKFEVL